MRTTGEKQVPPLRLKPSVGMTLQDRERKSRMWRVKLQPEASNL
jgi:hypothetical protein